MAKRNVTPTPQPAESGEAQEFPKTKYRRTPVSAKYPNGYEARRVEDAESEARLDAKVWKDSPDEL